MTRDEILAKWESMTPRERDEWVDNVIMNRYEATWEHGSWVYPAPRTRNMVAAWEVKEKIYRMDKVGLVGRYMTELLLIVDSNGFKVVHATPEQRCKAALLAVMGE